MKWVSSRAETLAPSPTINLYTKVLRMKKAGIDIINLAVGEPRIDTPEHIKDAAKDALDKGDTFYPDSQGVPELREAIAEKLLTENSVEADPKKEILVTIGGKPALSLPMMATINPGDEVIMTDPCFVSFASLVRLVGGIPVFTPLLEEENFQINPDDCEKRITARTKMILINTPINPVGSVLRKNTLGAIADIAKKHDLLVLTDEIYEKVIYDGHKHYSIASFSGMKERTITANAFSKSYTMTGWRVGYIVAQADLIKRMLALFQHTYSTGCPFTQRAAIAALKGPQNVYEEMLREFEKERNFAVNELNKIHKLSCWKPEATWYLFPNVSKFGKTSLEISDFLLEKARVAVTPGSAFGLHGEGHIRLQFTRPIEVLKEGVERIRNALELL